MLEKSYRWAMSKAETRSGSVWLGLISFAEASVFPLPPDIILVPMILARPDRWLRLALLATVTSVVGGLVGYAIGYFLFESIGQWVIDTYGLQDNFATFQALFREWGVLILVAKGATPVPFKLLTITAGFVPLDLTTFVLASVLSRFLRFFVVAALLRLFGPSIKGFIERRLALVSASVLVITVLGFLAFRLI